MKKILVMCALIAVLSASCSVVDFEEVKTKANVGGGTVIVEGNDLYEKLSWVKNNALHNTTYVIQLIRNELVDENYYSSGINSLSYNRKNVTVILTGLLGECTIKANSGKKNYLFEVKSGVTLVLDKNIELEGATDSGEFTYAVFLDGGNLIMNTGSTIAPNGDNCGGVYVGSSGNFTMNAGEIHDASSDIGGAVYVNNGGTFTMNYPAALISNQSGVFDSESETFNKSGTVFVNMGGSFLMNGGEILYNNSCGVETRGSFIMTGGGIERNGSHGVLVRENGKFTMSGGWIFANEAGGVGGVGIYDSGEFYMKGGHIANNYNELGGGGVYLNSGTFTMNGGEIYNNRSFYGGGLYINSGTFTMDGGEIYDNRTYNDGDGGGVYIDGGTLNMNNGIISNNYGFGSGGGIYMLSGTINMNGGTISGNFADYYSTGSRVGGGGVYISFGTFTMNGGTISGNTSEMIGGGVYNCAGNFTLNNGIISGNTAKTIGGGVYCLWSSGMDSNDHYGTLNMYGGTISGNTAGEKGGGVYIADKGIITKSGGTITGISAPVTENDNLVDLNLDRENPDPAPRGSGHAVYIEGNDEGKPVKFRDSGAGTGVDLDSDVEGTEGGWEVL